jgi:hypothetical protein
MADTTGQQSSTVAHDITRNPASIWLSPMCDETAHHGEGRTWAVPAPDETCEDCSEPWVEYVRSDLASVSSASAEGGERYRHVKRGTVYEIVGRAELQTAGPGVDILQDGDILVVYRGGDGKLWARKESEFNDGRFEPIAASPEPVPATNQAGEVEGAIRIAVWNACRDRGMGQDNATMLVREVLAQPVLTAALATQPATSQEELRKAFRTAAQGHGRAGSADLPGGPDMSMDDAADVYAELAANTSSSVALVQWARDQQAFPENSPCGSGRGHIDENHRFRLRDMVAAIDIGPSTAQIDRIKEAVEQYRNAPFRSADWLAGELMTILDTEAANDRN